MQVYVQNLMVAEENAAKLWADFQRGGYIYVCGGTAMGADINKTLLSIAEKNGLSKAEQEAMLSSLKTSGRYIQELWN